MLDIFNLEHYFLNWNAIFPALTGVIIIFTGFYVFIKHEKSALTWAYLVFTIMLSLWMFGFGLLYSIKDYELAYFLNNNFFFFGIIFIPANFYFFSSAFIGLNQRRIVITIIGYILAVFFYILTIKGLLIPELKLFYWGWYPQISKFYYLPFLILFYSYMVAGFYNLYLVWRHKRLFIVSGNTKLLFAAFIVGYLSSIDFLPGFGIAVYPFGFIFLLIFNSIMAFLAVIRKLVVITPKTAANEIIKTMAESLIVVDYEFNIKFINNAAVKLFKYNEDELIGKPYFEMLKDFQYEQKEFFTANIFKGNFTNIDIDYITKEKKTVPCRVSISPLHDKEKKTIGHVIASSDVSEVKKYIFKLRKLKAGLERKVVARTADLKKERDKIAAIISNLVDPVIVADNEGRLSLVNEAAVKVLGIKKKTIGKKIVNKKGAFSTTELKDVCDSTFIVNVKKSKNNSEEEELVLDNHKKADFPQNPFLSGSSYASDGQVYKVITVPVYGSNKYLYGKMKIFYNLTKEKHLDKIKTEFISIAAHQLRTPLSAIKWSIKMVIDGDAGKVNSEQINILSRGYKSNERSIKLVNQLLDVARIEEGGFVLKLSECNFGDILKEILLSVNENLFLKKIKLTKKIEKSLPTIKIDKDKIILALTNLLDNSIKYTPLEGSINLSAKASGKFLEFSIKDNGLGITEQDKQKIFGKFFRGENVVRVQTDGSGLGLFITKNIIQEHKGSISFTSKEAIGTEFVVSLPIT